MWPFPSHKGDAQTQYTQGLDHLLRGNLQKAYQSFKEVIDSDTDHTAAYLKLGQVLRQGGAADRALKLHESLLARPALTNYEQIELLKHLALDHLELGQYERAVERALSILKVEKRDTWALRHLVTFYRKQGDWAAAGKYLALWQKATDKDDARLRAWCRFRQGYDRRDADPPGKVREHYQEALKIDEKFSPAHFYLAASYADEAVSRRTGQATNGDTEGQRSEVSTPTAEDEISQLYSRAVSHWASFAEISPTETSLVLPMVEETLFYLQRFDDVESFLRQVLEKDPENLDCVASLANFYVRKGELDRAEHVLGTIPEVSAENPLIHAIQLKLSYRRNANQNLLPQLDRLVDAIRVAANNDGGELEASPSPMSWLDPSNDPLEDLE